MNPICTLDGILPLGTIELSIARVYNNADIFCFKYKTNKFDLEFHTKSIKLITVMLNKLLLEGELELLLSMPAIDAKDLELDKNNFVKWLQTKQPIQRRA